MKPKLLLFFEEKPIAKALARLTRKAKGSTGHQGGTEGGRPLQTPEMAREFPSNFTETS